MTLEHLDDATAVEKPQNVPGNSDQRSSTRSASRSAAAGKNGRQLSWDLIRVIAIVEVVLFHTTSLGPHTKPGIPAAPFLWDYPFGASTLLVVSGYFAAVTIGKYSPGWWFVRRLARLLPAYFAAVVVVFTVLRLFAPDDLDLAHLDFGDLIGNLLLVQLLFPDQVQFVDVSYWTLPIQIAGFAAIALLVRLRVFRGRVALGTLWAVLLTPLVVRWVWMGHAPAKWLVTLVEGTGLSRAHLLIAGVAIWLWSRKRMGIANLALMLMMVLVAQKVHPPTGNSIGMLAVMLVLVSVAARWPDWHLPDHPVLTRPITWLAGCSYGIYLMHESISYVIEERLAARGVSPWLWLSAAIGTAVLLGWALTRLVERPSFNYFDRRIKARLARG